MTSLWNRLEHRLRELSVPKAWIFRQVVRDSGERLKRQDLLEFDGHFSKQECTWCHRTWKLNFESSKPEVSINSGMNVKQSLNLIRLKPKSSHSLIDCALNRIFTSTARYTP